MNVAYADGSHRGEQGGWGVVLLLGGELRQLSGQLSANDNGVVELMAALQALRHSPSDRPLALHTDSAPAVQALARGSNHPEHRQLARSIHTEARERGVRLRVERCSREARRMKEAHALARAALDGLEPPSQPVQVRLRIQQSAAYGGGSELHLRFLRGHTQSAKIFRPLQRGVPPALQALLALLEHARDGEALQVSVNSALLPILWERGADPGDPAAAALLVAAQGAAAERGITLEFV